MAGPCMISGQAGGSRRLRCRSPRVRAPSPAGWWPAPRCAAAEPTLAERRAAVQDELVELLLNNVAYFAAKLGNRRRMSLPGHRVVAGRHRRAEFDKPVRWQRDGAERAEPRK